MSKFTKWHKGNVKPVHVGVYETDNRGFDNKCFQFWNGDFWCGAATSISGAVDFYNYESMYQNDKWRGLANKPKGFK